jgi:hypothetical protein
MESRRRGDRICPDEPMGDKISKNFLKMYFTNGMFRNNVVSDCHHHCTCPYIPKVAIITDIREGL